MQVIEGLLDYATPWTLPDVYLFTGNPIVNAAGKLVMGRGAAKVCRDRYRGCDHAFAAALATAGGRHVVYLPLAPGQFLGWFQVKAHWQQPADLAIIQASVAELAATARRRPGRRFHLNAPGIGNGRLAWSNVAPLLAPLPDNVAVYVAPECVATGPKVLNKHHGGDCRGAVYVGRPSKWGNPWSHLPNTQAAFRVESRDAAVDAFGADLLRRLDAEPGLLEQLRGELRGRDLVCWCAPHRCHADVLLRIANA